MNMRLVVGVSFFVTALIVSSSTHAATINFNLQVALDPSQIYQCAVGPGPDGTQCWTNVFSRLNELPRTTIGPEDTIRIQLDFLGPYRLQWADDPFTFDGADELVQVGTWDSLNYFGFEGTWQNALSFHGVTGDLKANNLAWTCVCQSGGLVSNSYESGTTNLTDSSFILSGLVAHIGPFAGTGLPQDVDRVAIFLQSGEFSIVSVPEPGTLALCGIGLAFFAVFFAFESRSPTSRVPRL